jgi:4-amino-4-deoxy-L-arabinose transferase-like glycosyltransferase
MHWIIGAAAAALTAGLAGALFDRRVGLLAGLLVAFDPFLVFFSSLLLTETAFVAVIVGLAWVLTPLVRSGSGSAGRWALVGLVAALAVYVRESSLGLVMVLLGFVVLCRRFDRRTLAGAVLAMAIVFAALTPWAVRNKRVVGEWCWLTTRGGISLYDGVGPQATGASNLGNVKQMPAVRGKTEVDWNRYFLTESLEAMRADPGRIARLAGVKMARMWNPVPNVETYQSLLVRTVSAAWTLPVFLCAVAGVWMLRARQRGEGLRFALFLLLPALYLTLLHSLFVGSVRYRLGAMPLLEVLAALAVVDLMDRFRSGATTGESSVVD